LTGKTISVVGAFKLINPKSWLLTPVELEVQ
jgi:predicted lipoprotein